MAGSLLDTQFSDAKDFRQFVFASETTFSTPSGQPEISPSVFNAVHSMFEKSMLGMHQKEASGVPLLAVFILNIVQKLNEQFVDLKFSADMEYTVMDTKRAGVNPSCDTAMVVTVLSQTDNQPIILYEYKPVVDPRGAFVNTRDLLEALIQGFYCVHFRKVKSIVQCLTDMHTWHFMKLNKQSNHINIEWYKSIKEDTPNVQTHVSFIGPIVTGLTQCSRLVSGLVSSLSKSHGSTAT